MNKIQKILFAAAGLGAGFLLLSAFKRGNDPNDGNGFTKFASIGITNKQTTATKYNSSNETKSLSVKTPLNIVAVNRVTAMFLTEDNYLVKISDVKIILADKVNDVVLANKVNDDGEFVYQSSYIGYLIHNTTGYSLTEKTTINLVAGATCFVFAYNPTTKYYRTSIGYVPFGDIRVDTIAAQKPVIENTYIAD